MRFALSFQHDTPSRFVDPKVLVGLETTKRPIHGHRNMISMQYIIYRMYTYRILYALHIYLWMHGVSAFVSEVSFGLVHPDSPKSMEVTWVFGAFGAFGLAANFTLFSQNSRFRYSVETHHRPEENHKPQDEKGRRTQSSWFSAWKNWWDFVDNTVFFPNPTVFWMTFSRNSFFVQFRPPGDQYGCLGCHQLPFLVLFLDLPIWLAELVHWNSYNLHRLYVFFNVLKITWWAWYFSCQLVSSVFLACLTCVLLDMVYRPSQVQWHGQWRGGAVEDGTQNPPNARVESTSWNGWNVETAETDGLGC